MQEDRDLYVTRSVYNLTARAGRKKIKKSRVNPVNVMCIINPVPKLIQS